jgi:hypothetical protein
MTTLKSRLYATSTALTLSGLILAMGAPVKWSIIIPSWWW